MITVAAFIATTLLTSVTHTTSHIIDLTAPAPTVMIKALKYTFVSIALLMLSLVACLSGFCYFRMLSIILSTSSKLARLKRIGDEEAKKVKLLHQKLYALILLASVLGALSFVDTIFNRMFKPSVFKRKYRNHLSRINSCELCDRLGTSARDHQKRH